MEEMSKKTKRLEKENLNLTRKQEATNKNIFQMAEERSQSQQTIDRLTRENEKLKKLCRAMQTGGYGSAGGAAGEGEVDGDPAAVGGADRPVYDGEGTESEYEEEEEEYDEDEEEEGEYDDDTEEEDIQQVQQVPRAFGPPPPPPPQDGGLPNGLAKGSQQQQQGHGPPQQVNGTVNGVRH